MWQTLRTLWADTQAPEILQNHLLFDWNKCLVVEKDGPFITA